MIAGALPSAPTKTLLEPRDAGRRGLSFQEYGIEAGILAFTSDGMGAPSTAQTLAGRHGPAVAADILSGSRLTEVGPGMPPQDPGLLRRRLPGHAKTARSSAFSRSTSIRPGAGYYTVGPSL